MPSYTSSIVAISALSLGSASMDFSRKGLGVQRQKHSLQLQEPTDCEHVEEFRFKEAVIDNFSPINDQKLWEGEGQRYWLNKGKMRYYHYLKDYFPFNFILKKLKKQCQYSFTHPTTPVCRVLGGPWRPRVRVHWRRGPGVLLAPHLAHVPLGSG
jgi:hypothetical protein